MLFQKPDAAKHCNVLLRTAFAVTLYVSWGWDFGAKLVPQVIGWTAVSLTGYLLITSVFFSQEPFDLMAKMDGISALQPKPRDEAHFDITADYGDLTPRTIFRRAMVYFAWLFLFLAAALVVGLLPAMFLFLIGYIRFEGKESWRMTLAVPAPTWILAYILFHKILIIPWPQALLGDWLGFLRSSNWLNLM